MKSAKRKLFSKESRDLLTYILIISLLFYGRNFTKSCFYFIVRGNLLKSSLHFPSSLWQYLEYILAVLFVTLLNRKKKKMLIFLYINICYDIRLNLSLRQRTVFYQFFYGLDRQKYISLFNESFLLKCVYFSAYLLMILGCIYFKS